MKKIGYWLLVISCWLLVVGYSGCSIKTPIKSKSAIIIFKTKKFKFADYGFVTKYNNFINLKILNAGIVVLNIDVYKNKVCFEDSSIRCQSSQSFNKEYLSSHYKDDFLYNILNQDKIYFKDPKEKILIKIRSHNG
jgi:hypothetical protein